MDAKYRSKRQPGALQHQIASLSHDERDAVALHALRQNDGLWAWNSGFARIQNKRGFIEPLRPNPLQIDIFDCVVWCLENGIPCRILSLKSRQKGSSTAAMDVAIWALRRAVERPVRGLVIGGQYSQVDNLWSMGRRFVQLDLVDWGHTSALNQTAFRFGNGSELLRETANDKEAARSGTYQVVIATEVARWAEEGVANATQVMTGVFACMPPEPGTIAILDTTALGPSGLFHEYWLDGVDWADVKAGRADPRGRFIRIFSPWNVHDDSWVDLTLQEASALRRSYTDEERLLVAEYSLVPEQVEYRRRTIRIECKRDPAIFRREFPFTPQEAFSASAPSIFNSEAIAYMRLEAEKAKKRAGVLDAPNPASPERVAFRPVDREEHEEIWIWDDPKPGERFLVAVDVMSGEWADEFGDNKDSHCAIVLRAPYRDEQGVWHPIREVAATALVNGVCQWPVEKLARVVWRLARYYGNAMIVPEANFDRGLIMLLRQMNALLYQRKRREERLDLRSADSSGKFGFLTTTGTALGTRQWIVEHLAGRVLEWDNTEDDGIEIPDLALLAEMEVFWADKKGIPRAIKGKHDDRVMSLAIGVATIAAATEYKLDTFSTLRKATDPLIKDELRARRLLRRQSALRGFS